MKKTKRYQAGGVTVGSDTMGNQGYGYETPPITIEPPFSTQPVQAQSQEASGYAYNPAAAQPDQQGFQNTQAGLQTLGATTPMKRGGKVKSYKSGGVVSSASKRGDGIAQRGKTRGRMV